MENQVFADNVLQVTLGGYLSGQLHDEEFAGFRRITAPVRLILDVGANRGQSIATLKVLFPDAIIHAFEANPLVAAVISETSVLWGLLYNKLLACMLVIFIFRVSSRAPSFAKRGLTLTALVYTCVAIASLWEILH